MVSIKVMERFVIPTHVLQEPVAFLILALNLVFVSIVQKALLGLVVRVPVEPMEETGQTVHSAQLPLGYAADTNVAISYAVMEAGQNIQSVARLTRVVVGELAQQINVVLQGKLVAVETLALVFAVPRVIYVVSMMILTLVVRRQVYAIP